MPCSCSVNTLRLFVRSLAHIEVPDAPTLTSRAHQFRNGSIPKFTGPGARRAFQTSSTSFSTSIQQDNPSDSQAGSEIWQRTFDDAEKRGGPKDTESAIVEISPESIDAIAADIKQAPTPQAEPSRPPQKDSHGRERKGEGKPSDSPVRRTRVENTSFAIHYSSPIAPPKSSNDRIQDGSHFVKSGSKSTSDDDWTPPKKEHWQIQKAALKEKFPDGWSPSKRLSPDAMVGIRALHAQVPEKYTTGVLAEHFKVSPEAIRRILKSKWQPDADTQVDREMRWFRRGERVWSRYAELGVKPPRVWRDQGIGRGKPEWKKKKELPAIPALLTTARREDGYYGGKVKEPALLKSIRRVGVPTRENGENVDAGKKRMLSERHTELITTARPPDGQGEF
ncbi:hypothetical protein G7Y89_g13728 [Cudoniella acicularis]|uniref:Required for respiratory growth protein 9, mitochondrial n=1 Tax=Cudoniella acicularis TaxID=354080 RepID=A0A8H4RA38_9HELO|nr:hypothetical protein G7Y89_g13728 [Cudoniella acicularis]